MPALELARRLWLLSAWTEPAGGKRRQWSASDWSQPMGPLVTSTQRVLGGLTWAHSHRAAAVQREKHLLPRHHSEKVSGGDVLAVRQGKVEAAVQGSCGQGWIGSQLP